MKSRWLRCEVLVERGDLYLGGAALAVIVMEQLAVLLVVDDAVVAVVRRLADR